MLPPQSDSTVRAAAPNGLAHQIQRILIPIVGAFFILWYLAAGLYGTWSLLQRYQQAVVVPAAPPSAAEPVSPAPPVVEQPQARPPPPRVVNRPALPLARSRSIEQAISRLQCGWARVRTVGKLSILEGVASAETVADLLLTRGELPLPKQPDLKLQLFTNDPLYCLALGIVQRIQRTAGPGASKFSVRLRLPLAAQALLPDQMVRFDVTPPDFPGFLRVDLLTRTGDKDTAGRVIVQHMIPRDDPAVPRSNHPAVFSAATGADFTIPWDLPNFDGWAAYLPEDTLVGADLIIATWTARNQAVAEQSSDDENDVESYLARLARQLDQSGGADPVAITAVLIPINRGQ